jgi:hypothetical protein
MKTIRRYGNAAEAGFAQSLLVAAGIAASLADENAGSLFPPLVPWGIRLQVPDEEVDRAHRILNSEGGWESNLTGLPPDAPDFAEHEVIPPDSVEAATPEITCPTCGAAWALTEQEAAQPSFTCADCGTVLPREIEVSAIPGQSFNWRCFLPRSESKWVFVLVMVAYNQALQLILHLILSPFVGPGSSIYPLHGWGDVLGHLAGALVWAPLWQTLLLIAIIEGLRALQFPPLLQVLISAPLVAATDGLHWWPHAVYSFPGFFLFAVSYLYWRPTSWRKAAAVAIAIHALFNVTADFHLITNQIQRERISSLLTGDPWSWDRADSFYKEFVHVRRAGNESQETALLQRAIDAYPYDSSYYLSLGAARWYERNQLKQSEAAFRNALALHQYQYEWDAWEWLSFVLSDENRPTEALDAARHALIICPIDKQSGIQQRIDLLKTEVSGTR